METHLLFPMPTMHLKFIGGRLYQLWYTSPNTEEWKEVPSDEGERQNPEGNKEGIQG